ANLTGFLGVEIEAVRRARVYLTFDEIATDGFRDGGLGDVDWKRLGCVNVVALELEPGRHRFESFEPYTLRYCKVLVASGDLTLERLWLRELANPEVDAARFASSDRRLNRLFEAGKETFRQNAVDLFMDCPSRERAGWLCDSFFTARVAAWFGDAAIERNFLENFALPESFAGLPKGMLPMCYPADHPDRVFIPNWALWFVVQLEEYLARTGDRELIERLRARVTDLFAFLERYRNEDGLLEKLPGWVFVEWSKANDWVQDVNYPSNMLFARALDVAGRLYDRADWREGSAKVRAVVAKQSFDGRFFVDNAVRRDGKLSRTDNRSEVCQYFAFYFGTATPSSHPELWRTLREGFGPERRRTRAYPEVAPANAFVGNVLRLELLSREGRTRQLLEESVGYQLYMAERTGTLWENDGDYASCNHGFASHVVHVLYRDVLGLKDVDPVTRRVTLRFGDSGTEWCEGSVPVPGGRVGVSWWKEGDGFRYRLQVPEGYRVLREAPSSGTWTPTFD
ncbi:MAG: hypothetical protein JNL97_11885, partial [Verrucomicrobiales bacterium]|nr:hypothetical protein [Verrucomicrobiales bacterium]